MTAEDEKRLSEEWSEDDKRDVAYVVQQTQGFISLKKNEIQSYKEQVALMGKGLRREWKVDICYFFYLTLHILSILFLSRWGQMGFLHNGNRFVQFHQPNNTENEFVPYYFLYNY